MQLRRIEATRYVTPLREGGSLPALVEADDDGLYVLKFRGAGQGPKALVAEIVAGELARALGLPCPSWCSSSSIPRSAAPSPTRRSRICSRKHRPQPRRRFPARRAPVQPGGGPEADPALAAAIVWFDALVTNVDRTRENTNMLLWHDRLWLIDHGAALYFHHAPSPSRPRARRRSRRSRPRAPPVRGSIREADDAARAAGHARAARRDRRAVPAEWLDGEDAPCTPTTWRAAGRAARLRGGGRTVSR